MIFRRWRRSQVVVGGRYRTGRDMIEVEQVDTVASSATAEGWRADATLRGHGYEAPLRIDATLESAGARRLQLSGATGPARRRHPGVGLLCPRVRRRVSFGSSHAASVTVPGAYGFWLPRAGMVPPAAEESLAGRARPGGARLSSAGESEGLSPISAPRRLPHQLGTRRVGAASRSIQYGANRPNPLGTARHPV
jgi:hypothetical protein